MVSGGIKANGAKGGRGDDETQEVGKFVRHGGLV